MRATSNSTANKVGVIRIFCVDFNKNTLMVMKNSIQRLKCVEPSPSRDFSGNMDPSPVKCD